MRQAMAEFAPHHAQQQFSEMAPSDTPLPSEATSSQTATMEQLPTLDALQQLRLQAFITLVSQVDEHIAKKDKGEQWNMNLYDYDTQGQHIQEYSTQKGKREAKITGLQPITWDTIEAWKQTATGLYEGFAQRSPALKRHADHYLTQREQQRAEQRQKELEQLTHMWDNGPTNI